VIVPTYSRPERLAQCLRALNSLDKPGENCEIIVVDDGSGAEEAAATEELCRAAEVTLLRQTRAGPATARNTGAAAARGRYLAFLDDDCEPASDWLEEITLALDGAPDAAFGGRTVNAMGRNRYSAASQALIDYLYFYYANERNGTNRGGFFASNNLVVPTESFRALGGFDETYPFAAGEDRDLCDRWLARGLSLVYLSGALVYHTHPMTFATFCKKHFDYGRGALRFHRDRARRSADRIRFEPVRFYANLITWPFKQSPLVSPPTLAALLLVAQVAQASGFVFEASSGRARRRETSLPERRPRSTQRK
jgi:GT2 family glycosyltransferase